MVRAFEGVLCVNKPIDMVCYKALCDVGQFYLLFNSLRLLLYMQFQNQIESSLYSPYYDEACNELRGPSQLLSAWATQLGRNVATVASR